MPFRPKDELVNLYGTLPHCRCATTAAITPSGLQTVDSVSVYSGDRVLVKNQATALDNGIYIAQSGSWPRAGDMELEVSIPNGLVTFIRDGTTYGNRLCAMRYNAGVGGMTVLVGYDQLNFVFGPVMT